MLGRNAERYRINQSVRPQRDGGCGQPRLARESAGPVRCGRRQVDGLDGQAGQAGQAGWRRPPARVHDTTLTLSNTRMQRVSCDSAPSALVRLATSNLTMILGPSSAALSSIRRIKGPEWRPYGLNTLEQTLHHPHSPLSQTRRSLATAPTEIFFGVGSLLASASVASAWRHRDSPVARSCNALNENAECPGRHGLRRAGNPETSSDHVGGGWCQPTPMWSDPAVSQPIGSVLNVARVTLELHHMQAGSPTFPSVRMLAAHDALATPKSGLATPTGKAQTSACTCLMPCPLPVPAAMGISPSHSTPRVPPQPGPADPASSHHPSAKQVPELESPMRTGNPIWQLAPERCPNGTRIVCAHARPGCPDVQKPRIGDKTPRDVVREHMLTPSMASKPTPLELQLRGSRCSAFLGQWAFLTLRPTSSPPPLARGLGTTGDVGAQRGPVSARGHAKTMTMRAGRTTVRRTVTVGTWGCDGHGTTQESWSRVLTSAPPPFAS
jgi:hypothetical protein